MTPEDTIREQNAYSGVTAWHEAGIDGQGVVIWNAEAAGQTHGETTERCIKDVAPGATVITAMPGLSYTPEKIISNTVTHQGQVYSVEEFIRAFGVKIVSISRGGGKAAGQAISDFWNDLKTRYNLIFCNAAGNEGTDSWGGAVPYDVAIYVGAANLIKGKPQRANYSSVTKELDFMQFTGCWSGTSFSTPRVAGMAALLAQVKPGITQDEVYGYFIKHSEDMYTEGADAYTGYGLAKMGPIGEDWEGDEMITKTKIKVDGRILEVRRILKNGENYIRLRDFDEVLGICKVDYDPKAKLPIVKD